MNYRHVYHAGNFADVLKHAVLTRLIVYLQRKDAAFRIVDTHAGPGLYDLTSDQAQKTGEWRDGIGRLAAARLSDAAAPLLAPYLDAVASLNPEGPDNGVLVYPGSPKLARLLMRKQDRLSAIELHEEDCASLKRLFAGDFQTRVTRLDGWLALGAHLPPKERRGIVLIDPPFEEAGEFDRMAKGLQRAYRRFPGGVYCLWYPLKSKADVDGFHAALRASGVPRILACDLTVRDPRKTDGLAGSGLAVVNPPFTLPDELNILLPELVGILGQDSQAAAGTAWIATE